MTAYFKGANAAGTITAALALADELGRRLYKIDLSRVVSKYIGETEKNLNEIFDAAARQGAILFFDEADALFGKRTDVHDSHDKYADREINHFLKRLECYEGVIILAGNSTAGVRPRVLRFFDYRVRFRS